MASKNVPKELEGYKTKEFLGKGTFANVFSCYKNNNRYALKRINSKEKFKKYALKEIEYLNAVDSEYVIKMEDHFITDNIQYLVFEYLYDNLYNYVLKNKNYPNFNGLTNYCYQISCGLEHLHSKDIIHCDLKLENIMISSNLQNIKIIDLGSSVIKNKIRNITNFYIQSRYYRAPEILYEINISEKIDIWSLGVIITELILKKCIFNGKNIPYMIYKISDYIDIPIMEVYKNSTTFEKLYDNYEGNYRHKDYKSRYRENKLEEYIIDGLRSNFDYIYDYQIDNMVALTYKILDYDYNTRLTAKQCKEELSILEFSIENKEE